MLMNHNYMNLFNEGTNLFLFVQSWNGVELVQLNIIYIFLKNNFTHSRFARYYTGCLSQGRALRVNKMHIKKHYLHSNIASEMKNASGKTRNIKEMKKALYLYNIFRADDKNLNDVA